MSLTPTSSWLSGLGHVSDDPQKYWRGGDAGSVPPILARGIAPMPQVFPQHQHSSRSLVGSFESGFAYEDLEKAVRQAQREERAASLASSSGAKVGVAAGEAKDKAHYVIERERDLARERERLRKLESDNKVRRTGRGIVSVEHQQFGSTSDRPSHTGSPLMDSFNAPVQPPVHSQRRAQMAGLEVLPTSGPYAGFDAKDDRSQGRADRP